MSEKPEVDIFAAYRAAGELFGRLKVALCFGQLSMWEYEGRIQFRLSFNARGMIHQGNIELTFDELLLRKDLVRLAEDTAFLWTRHFREATEKIW